jgi:hypothetical protein
MAAYVATTLRRIAEIRSANRVITIDGVGDAHAAMVLVANCGEVIRRSSNCGPGFAPTTACRRGRDAGRQLRRARRLGPAARRPHGGGRRDHVVTPGA